MSVANLNAVTAREAGGEAPRCAPGAPPSSQSVSSTQTSLHSPPSSPLPVQQLQCYPAPPLEGLATSKTGQSMSPHGCPVAERPVSLKPVSSPAAKSRSGAYTWTASTGGASRDRNSAAVVVKTQIQRRRSRHPILSLQATARHQGREAGRSGRVGFGRRRIYVLRSFVGGGLEAWRPGGCDHCYAAGKADAVTRGGDAGQARVPWGRARAVGREIDRKSVV